MPTSILQPDKIKNVPPEQADAVDKAGKPLLHDYYREVLKAPEYAPSLPPFMPRKKPSPPAKKADSAKTEDSDAGFKLRHDTDPKVSNRFKLFEPKDLTEKALRGYQDLEDKLFKYADDVRKLSFGMQLKDAYPEGSQSRKKY